MSRRRWSIAAIVVLGLVLSAAVLWWQLPGIRLDVREVTIDGLRLRIVRTERGELNIADLLRRPPSRKTPPAVNVDRLSLTAGALTVEDRAVATARTWRAEAITVEASA